MAPTGAKGRPRSPESRLGRLFQVRISLEAPWEGSNSRVHSPGLSHSSFHLIIFAEFQETLPSLLPNPGATPLRFLRSHLRLLRQGVYRFSGDCGMLTSDREGPPDWQAEVRLRVQMGFSTANSTIGGQHARSSLPSAVHRERGAAIRPGRRIVVSRHVHSRFKPLPPTPRCGFATRNGKPHSSPSPNWSGSGSLKSELILAARRLRFSTRILPDSRNGPIPNTALADKAIRPRRTRARMERINRLFGTQFTTHEQE